jgi:hypothetical protein
MTPTKHPHPQGHGQHDHLYAEPLHNEDVAHEHSDVNVRAVLMFCFGLMAVVGIMMAAMYGLFWTFEGQAAANDPIVTPLAEPAGQLPPEPRLLTDEPQNLQRFRMQEAEVLKNIDDAKKRLLEQGLPVRADAPADPWLGTYSPARGESSSGRAIPTRPGGTEPAQPVQPAAGQPTGEPKVPQTPPKSGGH